MLVACAVAFGAGVVVGGGQRSPGPVTLAGGDRATCALQDGEVTCWGAIEGTTARHRQVLEDAVAISAGGSAFCARLRDHRASCWTVAQPTPTDPGLSGVVDLAVSATHACAVLDDGSVRCWGGNEHAQLGTGATGPAQEEPVTAEVVDATAVAVGDGFSCVTVGSGAVVCWGRNDLGQGAQADGGPVLPEPVEVSGVEGATDLVAGAGHVCAVVDGGATSCWGDNGRGQLGRGAADASSATPGAVVNLRGVTSLASSAWSSCAITASGQVSCWGDDTFGQLGDGRRTDPRRQPVAAQLPAPATSVAPGSFHTCAALTDGTVRCWGANSDGQLGNGTAEESVTPVEVDLGRGG